MKMERVAKATVCKKVGSLESIIKKEKKKKKRLHYPSGSVGLRRRTMLYGGRLLISSTVRMS